jgi:hypothetical protein
MHFLSEYAVTQFMKRAFSYPAPYAFIAKNFPCIMQVTVCLLIIVVYLEI